MTYHREVPLQAEEHFMLPHQPEIGHFRGKQQGLLYSVGCVPSLALLEVSYGGIIRKKSSIQHYGGGLGWDCWKIWFYISYKHIAEAIITDLLHS